MWLRTESRASRAGLLNTLKVLLRGRLGGEDSTLSSAVRLGLRAGMDTPAGAEDLKWVLRESSKMSGPQITRSLK